MMAGGYSYTDYLRPNSLSALHGLLTYLTSAFLSPVSRDLIEGESSMKQYLFLTGIQTSAVILAVPKKVPWAEQLLRRC